MFGDTLRALAEANETGEDAFDTLDRKKPGGASRQQREEHLDR
jgi:hypothetical protein